MKGKIVCLCLVLWGIGALSYAAEEWSCRPPDIVPDREIFDDRAPAPESPRRKTGKAGKKGEATDPKAERPRDSVFGQSDREPGAESPRKTGRVDEKNEIMRLRQELAEARNQAEEARAALRSIAEILHVTADRERSINWLASEIRIKLDSSEGYSGGTLSEQDLELLSTLVTDADEPQLLKIIRQYDEYVKKCKGHTVVILP